MRSLAHTVLLTALLAFGAHFATPAFADAALDGLAKVIVDATKEGDIEAITKRFGPELAAGYKAAEENKDKLIIDFDWSTNSQDPQYDSIAKSIQSTSATKSADEGTVTVTFKQAKKDMTIDYKVKKAGADWVISDVVYPKDDFSLSDMVQGK